VLEGDKIDYKSAAKGSTLEVPPDLNQLSRETRYAVPGGVVSANALQAGQAAQPGGRTNGAGEDGGRAHRAQRQPALARGQPPGR
jgi:outer membrane protein assembly factor BamC